MSLQGIWENFHSGLRDMLNEKKTNGGHNNAAPPSFQAFYEGAIMVFTRKKKRKELKADAVKERKRERESEK